MARINIYETEDATTVEAQVTSNAVYVPGYSLTGPVDTPTLCESVAQFKAIFGEVPYTFTAQQNLPVYQAAAGEQQAIPGFDSNFYKAGSTIYALAGQAEQSYIYALELLKHGVPVYFDRIKSSALSTASKKIDCITYKITTTPSAQSPTATLYDVNKFAEKVDYSTSAITFTYSDGNWTITQGSETVIVDLADYGISSEATTGTITVSVDSTASTYKLKVEASSMGRAGSTIQIEHGYNLNLKAYELKINNVVKYYNFDISSDYYIENVNFGLVNVKLNKETTSGTTTTEEQVFAMPQNTVIKPIATATNLDYPVNVVDFSITDFYSNLSGRLEQIQDRNLYNIKFITSGSYPVFGYKTLTEDNGLTKTMLKIAGIRGNSTALIDYVKEKSLYENSSSTSDIFHLLKSTNGLKTPVEINIGGKIFDARKAGAMYGPYAKFNVSYNANETEIVTLPGSFGYLACLGESVKSNANYIAVAGATRGLIPNLVEMINPINTLQAEAIQTTSGISINPILYIHPYGYCIWGNRTLKFEGTIYGEQILEGELSATSFMNVRQLVSDVKSVVYATCKKLSFEPNSDILWLNFKTEVGNELDSMKAGNGLTSYKIERIATTKKATIQAKITLVTIEAVENFDIEINLSDSTVSVQ